MNQPPVIESITISADLVEVGSDVTVTAAVRDAETAIDQLIFEWAADGGTFTGQGPSVTWRAPHAGSTPTPTDYVLRLAVREPYGAADPNGVRPEHRVTASSNTIRVHDSARELADLSMRFLADFANSSVSADACVRDFTDSCSGKAEEREQIEDNRKKYQIVSSSLRLTNVSVSPNRLAANMTVNCSFSSIVKQCPADEQGCAVGTNESVRGECRLTAVYEQKRWWLCESRFFFIDGLPSMRAFFDR